MVDLYIYFMKVISLNIDETIFNETEKIVAAMKKPRNRYINEAIDFYNKHQKRAMLERKLQKESEVLKVHLKIGMANSRQEGDILMDQPMMSVNLRNTDYRFSTHSGSKSESYTQPVFTS